PRRPGKVAGLPDPAAQGREAVRGGPGRAPGNPTGPGPPGRAPPAPDPIRAAPGGALIMRPFEDWCDGAPWVGPALFQGALSGVAALRAGGPWRRAGPGLRAAVLSAALAGGAAVPRLGAVFPVWLPVPMPPPVPPRQATAPVPSLIPLEDLPKDVPVPA